jgi:hypothetical protein
VRSYGLEALYVVHPLESQRLLAEQLTRHWVEGAGRKRIPDRGEALETMRIVPDLASAQQAMGEGCQLWTTAAAARGGQVASYAEVRALAHADGPPALLLFGTGWGLTDALVARAEVRIEPIRAEAETGYNHLSVRAACAITLDRLFGPAR